LGALVIGVAAWIAASGITTRATRAERTDQAAASAAAAASSITPAASVLPALPVLSAAGAMPAFDASANDAGPSLDLDPLTFDAGVIPAGAPRSVRLGVVLIQFAGAEGASSAARAKADALAHAQSLLDEARTDFKKAVHEGDTGSSDDIGRVPRGVLDPRTEVAVFRLSSGEVSDVLETPRGYWIVKRLE